MRDTRPKKWKKKLRSWWDFDSRWYKAQARAEGTASIQGLQRQHQSQVHLPVKPLPITQTMRSVNRNR